MKRTNAFAVCQRNISPSKDSTKVLGGLYVLKLPGYAEAYHFERGNRAFLRAQSQPSQVLHHPLMATLLRKVQRVLATIGAHVRVRSVLHQHFHNL